MKSAAWAEGRNRSVRRQPRPCPRRSDTPRSEYDVGKRLDEARPPRAERPGRLHVRRPHPAWVNRIPASPETASVLSDHTEARNDSVGLMPADRDRTLPSAVTPPNWGRSAGE